MRQNYKICLGILALFVGYTTFLFQILGLDISGVIAMYFNNNVLREQLFATYTDDIKELGFHTGRNFTVSRNHPFYKTFYIKEPLVKESVTIIIIVSSAPKRIRRRNAIRATWWSQCVQKELVIPKCIFITDYQGPNDRYFHQVQRERVMNDDIHFQLVESGVTFGKRFINHMLFAETMYNFDYFLRVDDDQFLCLENILQELPFPVEKKFHWGWVHLHDEIRRPEESIILFSQDVINTFLMQDSSKMLCHPWADQLIAAWLTDLNIVKLLRHDLRIHHIPPIHESIYLKLMKNVCHSFIAVHGVYDNDMKILWKHRGNSLEFVNGNLKTNSILYIIKQPFNWTVFKGFWRYEPQLCITNPTWDTSRQMGNSTSYVGRQGN